MPLPSRDALDAPTVLLAAEGERLGKALAARMRFVGVAVEEVGLDELVQTAFVTAPDLVVLGGRAAADGGHALLEKLSEHHATAMLPVVLIGEGGGEKSAHAALRFGVVAIVDRGSGADRMARSIKALASELPERTGETSGMLDERELAGLVELLTESRRFGLLSVTDETGAALMHMVVRGDRPVEETINELVQRLKALGEERSKLRYEFQESSRARVGALHAADGGAGKQQLTDRRIMLVERNAARADQLAQALRAAGSTVIITTGAGEGLGIARELAPEVIVVYDEGVDDWAAETLRKIRRDVILCWGSLLVVKRDEIWRARRPDIRALSNGVLDLIQPDLELITRVRARATVDARLEIIGPARTLRALATTGLPLEVSVLHPRVKVELTIVDGMLGTVTARALRKKGLKPVEGPGALATLLHLPSGRVSIKRTGPSTSHLLMPVDEALAAAVEIDPAIAKSAPPPPSAGKSVFPKIPPAPPKPSAPAAPEPAPPAAPEGSQVALLVDRLQRLLQNESGDHTIVSAPPSESSDEARPVGVPFDVDEEDTTHTFDKELAARFRARMLKERAENVEAADAPVAAERSSSRREPTM